MEWLARNWACLLLPAWQLAVESNPAGAPGLSGCKGLPVDAGDHIEGMVFH